MGPVLKQQMKHTDETGEIQVSINPETPNRFEKSIKPLYIIDTMSTPEWLYWSTSIKIYNL